MLSVYAYLFGVFDYNKTPLVPPGTKILAHAKPSNWTSWGIKGDQEWTIGPALKQYRCIKCNFPDTRTERNVDTVTFPQKTIKFPEVNLEDFLQQSASDIITKLIAPLSTTTVLLQAGDHTSNALLEIATILKSSKLLPIVEQPKSPTKLPTNTAPIQLRSPPGFPPVPQFQTASSPRVQPPQKVLFVTPQSKKT